VAKKAKKVAKKKEAATPKHAFTIDQAAKEAGVTSAHLRLKLREAKVPKAGKSYGWTSKDAMLKDLKKVQPAAAAA
jgi:hypothetical protein